MVCEANISSVSAEPLLLRGGGGKEWVTCNDGLYIVAIPQSLHRLQLLLPINPPPPPPPLPTPQEACLNH